MISGSMIKKQIVMDEARYYLQNDPIGDLINHAPYTRSLMYPNANLIKAGNQIHQIIPIATKSPKLKKSIHDFIIKVNEYIENELFKHSMHVGSTGDLRSTLYDVIKMISHYGYHDTRLKFFLNDDFEDLPEHCNNHKWEFNNKNIIGLVYASKDSWEIQKTPLEIRKYKDSYMRETKFIPSWKMAVVVLRIQLVYFITKPEMKRLEWRNGCIYPEDQVAM
jgi:hypothetical protein